MSAVIVKIESSDTVTAGLENASKMKVRTGHITIEIDRSQWSTLIDRLTSCASQVWECSACGIPRAFSSPAYKDAPGEKFCDHICHGAWLTAHAHETEKAS